MGKPFVDLLIDNVLVNLSNTIHYGVLMFRVVSRPTLTVPNGY